MPKLQQPIPFDIDPNTLATDLAVSDRFVYTPWYVIYDPYVDADVSHISTHWLDRVALGLRLERNETVKEKLLHRYEGLADRVNALASLIAAIDQSGPRRQTGRSQMTTVADSVRELNQRVSRAMRSGEVTSEAGEALSLALSAAAAAAQNAGARQAMFVAPGGGIGSSPLQQGSTGAGGLAALAASELGYLFLDRTRIRPMGFALGEHIQSFSLAPGEEVTLEMKTYSKKEESFERSSEQERTFDVELSSTLTTELNEGMNSENSRNNNDTSTMSANVGGNIDGITFNVGPTSSNTLQNANRDSTTQSTKVAQTASTKVAARNRALHKTVFKVSTETRFETNSKRTLRNPNANTPIDLQYFKVLQRVSLSHERCGVRLCWSPIVADPGAALLAHLESAKAAIYARAAQAGAGPRPPEPVPAGSPPPPAPQTVSDSVVADRFDPVWGGQRYDYQITLLAPLGLQWDRATPGVTMTFTGSRPAAASLVSASMTPGGVLIVVHVGIEDNANPFKPQYWESRGTAVVSVTAGFSAASAPVAPSDPNYQAAMNAWRDAVATWEQLDRQAKADALAAADAEWAAVLKKAIDEANVMQEVIGAVVRSFVSAPRDLREVDFLEDVFDWKNAGLRLYAGWWAGHELHDPSRPADNFINAAWARLYLPIKVGAEAQALRWIYDRAITSMGSAATEKLITLVTGELDAYRTASFGSSNEIVVGPVVNGCPQITRPYLCLGHWDEVLPTDGTHLEVMQATSSAADDYGRSLLDDAGAMRAQQIERGIRENALRQKAETDGLGTVRTGVELNIGNDEPPGQER